MRKAACLERAVDPFGLGRVVLNNGAVVVLGLIKSDANQRQFEVKLRRKRNSRFLNGQANFDVP
jgi:hypothetical protein